MNGTLKDVKMLMAGECGLVVEFGAVISPAVNGIVQQLNRLLAARPIEGILEIVPTYRAVTLYFDPLQVSRTELIRLVRQRLDEVRPQAGEGIPARIIHVPVYYGGVLGPDLDFVARYTGLAAREVVALHTSRPYLVYMLGFTPGFPYLGGLPAELVVPRQEKPRAKVPAGSVGIGGSQTGLYPVESPGEWWLIGRTPLKVFDPDRVQPFLVAAGDYLHFEDIPVEEYFAIRRQVADGAYRPWISYKAEGEGL
ncbi:allophanate hydrolase subunit 1 [Lucifera butyrica]|uniref:Allophanate hydrolase subunit 1 n=1 Tax=Lucifera butyrica TaxID=1351585 RepID=A0A498RE86_9FIRM|nr:5-oxoprolinase subunit PxpB [Lucifera butyrica]VBB09801.1 allophanate hydrolase subunit 1 [Lucifera butyrica]